MLLNMLTLWDKGTGYCVDENINLPMMKHLT